MLRRAHSKWSKTFSGRYVWAHSGTTMSSFRAPVGPFKGVGSIFRKKILGPFGNIDTAFPCFGGPVQTSRKHSWEETTGSIREHRCQLCMLRQAHSKRSKTFSGRYVWACSGTTMSSFRAPVGPFKVVGNILEKKLLGPSVNIEATFPCFSGPIQGNRKITLRALVGPFKTTGNVLLIRTEPIRDRRNLLF